MSGDKKAEDIDAPILIGGAKEKAIGLIQRSGFSKKGIGIFFLMFISIVGLIIFGINNISPGGVTRITANSDMPGQTQAINITHIKKEAQKQTQNESQTQGLKVREEVPQTNQNQQQATNAPRQKTPAEMHQEWLERKKYERIQGQILAAESALTAELSKGGAGSAGSGLANLANAMRQMQQGDDPISRVAALRNNAHQNIQSGAVPGVMTTSPPANTAGVLNPLAQDNAVAAQLRNKEFLKEAGEAGYLPEQVKTKMGQHELTAGSVIPAVLLTGINSDLPGTIVGQVRQNIYSTFDENTLIIPQGSRIIGRYSSQIAYGQERVLVAWDELILPNGNRINLRGMQGADGIGQAGFSDQVDTHFWRIWGSATMVSLLGVGAQLSQPQNASYEKAPSLSQQAAAAAANSLNQAGSKAMEKNLNVSPTLTIRPGYLFNVIVNKSVIFPAYRSM